MPPVCNKDCLHCTQADCINDTMDYEDYQEADRLEREIILPRTAKQRRLAAQQKAYREANRDRLAAQKKAYYEANRDRLAAQQKAYREANRDRLAAQQKIRDRRLAAGYTQKALGDLVGVTNATICHWEKCKVPADWAKLERVFPGITNDCVRLAGASKELKNGKDMYLRLKK